MTAPVAHKVNANVGFGARIHQGLYEKGMLAAYAVPWPGRQLISGERTLSSLRQAVLVRSLSVADTYGRYTVRLYGATIEG